MPLFKALAWVAQQRAGNLNTQGLASTPQELATAEKCRKVEKLPAAAAEGEEHNTYAKQAAATCSEEEQEHDAAQSKKQIKAAKWAAAVPVKVVFLVKK